MIFFVNEKGMNNDDVMPCEFDYLTTDCKLLAIAAFMNIVHDPTNKHNTSGIKLSF